MRNRHALIRYDQPAEAHDIHVQRARTVGNSRPSPRREFQALAPHQEPHRPERGREPQRQVQERTLVHVSGRRRFIDRRHGVDAPGKRQHLNRAAQLPQPVAHIRTQHQQRRHTLVRRLQRHAERDCVPYRHPQAVTYSRFTIPVNAATASVTVPQPTSFRNHRNAITVQANASPLAVLIVQLDSTPRSMIGRKTSAA